MKILISIFALLALCGSARAQSAPATQMTNSAAEHQVVPYYNFCSSTTLSTVVTELTGNVNISTATAGISQLLLQNLSSSATEYFSSDSGVTTSTASRTGFALYPTTSGNPALPNWFLFGISTMQKWYGIAGAAGAQLQLCKIR